ncbi:hypothetical protein ACVW0P_002859 [Mucilaginibacter sp. UYNi724]
MPIIKYSFLFLLLYLKVEGSQAQNTVLVVSNNYLLDTTKTPATDRLWSTYTEGRVKFFQLNIYSACSPLLLDRPTFAYSSNQQTPKYLSKNEFDLLKKVSLSDLIKSLKQFADEDSKIDIHSKRIFFLNIIEPSSSGYTIVKTQLDGSGPKKVTN